MRPKTVPPYTEVFDGVRFAWVNDLLVALNRAWARSRAAQIQRKSAVRAIILQ
jgi:hypothetical protein